jgi:antitoxin ParD1/3/4
MDVSLTPELETFVADKVKSGVYQSPSEVINEGLRLLREREEKKRDELRREIAVGIEQAEQGKVAPLDARAVLADIRRGREARARE